MARFNDAYLQQPTNETYELQLARVEENKWIYDENCIKFRGRPASSQEQKRYVIAKGAVNNKNTVYIYATNLPETIKVDDRIIFNGDKKIVSSIGYYFDKTKIVDASIFDPEYIKAVSPKGITLD